VVCYIEPSAGRVNPRELRADAGTRRDMRAGAGRARDKKFFVRVNFIVVCNNDMI